MKFSVLTLGCRVNQYESEFIINSLVKAGNEYVNVKNNPDLIIINSCSVTEEAKRQSFQLVRRFKNSKKKVILTGCVVDDIKECKLADKCISNFYKKIIPNLINSKERFFYRDIFTENEFVYLPVEKFYNTTRGYLKIQDGCNNYCSYCRIIYLRGNPRSLSEDLIIQTIINLNKISEIKEIVLCGINISLYGAEKGIKNGLFLLLKNIDSVLSSKKVENLRIRLSSLRPEIINSDFVRFLNASNYFCSHLHLSIQNLNDHILQLMNRNYKFKDIERIIEIIKKENEFINIGCDIITGFPEENEDRFIDNLKKLENLDINYFHVFPFSRKKGTKAYEFKDSVDKLEKKRRVKILKTLSEKKKKNFIKKNLGKIHRVLIEKSYNGIYFGYSDNYLRFKIEVDLNQLKNKFINVIAKRIEKNLTVGGEFLW